MKGDCPLTGETAEITTTGDRLAVKHPGLGDYVVDADALPLLRHDAEARERMARWLTESHSLGFSIPRLAAAHVNLFQYWLDFVEPTFSEWTERRDTIVDADHARLWRKLRLEWNYNTNHIEGNTLTYHETELLLIHGRTAGEHPMRHYEEMKAHDVAIDHTRHLASAERVLGEGDIRDLNKILLKEPFWHIAQTPDGRETRKRILPGEYKRQPNHVRSSTGELHRFAEPEETPALMERWTRDFRRDLGRNAYPLPLFLAESHWSFLRIHPFDDGNGRTARLLTNYVLLRRGLPPIVIKSAERDRYIGALQNADVGRIMPLAGFMVENILWSLGLAIRAAKGESIREAGDVGKEVELFVRRTRAKAPKASDVELLDAVFHRWIRPTLDRAETALEPLRNLFHSTGWHSTTMVGRHGVQHGSHVNVFHRQHWKRTKQSHIVSPGFHITDEIPVELRHEYRLRRYTGRGARVFSLALLLAWKLDGKGVRFVAEIDGKPIVPAECRVRYSELSACSLEVDRTVDAISQAMMAEIERRST